MVDQNATAPYDGSGIAPRSEQVMDARGRPDG